MKRNKKHLKQHGNKQMKKEQLAIEQAQNDFKDAQIFVSKKRLKYIANASKSLSIRRFALDRGS